MNRTDTTPSILNVSDSPAVTRRGVLKAGAGLTLAVAAGPRDDLTVRHDHAADRHLAARGGGSILSTASMAGQWAIPADAAYCASKAGVNAFSDALMQEVRHEGIRVTVVLPGSVDTEFSGRTRDGSDWRLSPDDVAQMAVAVLSERFGRYVAGTTIDVDGGLGLISWIPPKAN